MTDTSFQMILRRLRWSIPALLLSVTACHKSEPPGLRLYPAAVRTSDIRELSRSELKRLNKGGALLARQHTLSLEVSEASLSTAYHRLIDGCNQPAINCTLLRAELATGDRLSASLCVRLAPTVLPKIEQSASALGTIVYQSSTAEDLTDAINDT